MGAWKLYRGVCLAALHHIDDKAGFLASLMRGRSGKGLLHIGDVEADSPIAEFLDGFVGRYNVTGHKGRHLSASAIPAPPEVQVLRAKCLYARWRLETEHALVAFCTGLFGLRNCPPRVLVDAFEGLVVIEGTATGIS